MPIFVKIEGVKGDVTTAIDENREELTEVSKAMLGAFLEQNSVEEFDFKSIQFELSNKAVDIERSFVKVKFDVDEQPGTAEELQDQVERLLADFDVDTQLVQLGNGDAFLKVKFDVLPKVEIEPQLPELDVPQLTDLGDDLFG